MTPHLCYNVCDSKTTERETNQAKQSSLFFACTHRKSEKPSFPLWPPRFRKVARPPSDLLNYTPNTKRHTHEKKEHPHSEKGTPCSNYNQNRRTQTSQLQLRRNATSLQTSHPQIFFKLSACRSCAAVSALGSHCVHQVRAALFLNLRRRRRGSAARKRHDQYWNVHGLNKNHRAQRRKERSSSF